MNTFTPKWQRGLSLIELMIAMVLSLLLMLGVMQIFLSSKQTYTSTEALSRVQENGRFAITFLGYDIRNASYKGECLSSINNISGSTSVPYTLDTGLYGIDSSQNSPAWFTGTRDTGTDAILLKHAAGNTGLTLSATAADSLTTTAATGIKQNSYVVVSDPVSCDLFKNSSTDTASALTSAQAFPRIYPTASEILQYQSVAYYIEGAALKRINYADPSPAAAELMTGVTDLQVKYATGNVYGQVTGDYVDAQNITNWEAVISVQVTLKASSLEANNPTTREFTSTIGIRNRLP